MTKRPTPTERFVAEIPADRRRAYDARMLDRGLKRVSVTVPAEHLDSLKTFARFLRNSPSDFIELCRADFDQYLADCYRAYDEDVAAGRFSDD